MPRKSLVFCPPDGFFKYRFRTPHHPIKETGLKPAHADQVIAPIFSTSDNQVMIDQCLECPVQDRGGDPGHIAADQDDGVVKR